MGRLVFRRPDIVAEFVYGMLESERARIRACGHTLESLPALIDDQRNDEFVLASRTVRYGGRWRPSVQPVVRYPIVTERALIELYRAVEAGRAQEEKILNLFDQYWVRDLFDKRGEIGRYERH